MIQKTFSTSSGYLHIPVHGSKAETAYYVEVIADGVCRNEFLINLRMTDDLPYFYVAMHAARYGTSEITLVCRDENAPADLFDDILEGKRIVEEPELYPNLYQEPYRQRIHFSPARGWLNDPNGLFYQNGVFHMYFQHNPLANQHMATNLSWGHATTTDCVHFQEHPDAMMPRNSLLHVASGSAVVDQYNIAGFGEDAIIAAYTDLESPSYLGRMPQDRNAGQNIMISIDGGMTFRDIAEGVNPVIPVVPYTLKWRDPKLLFLDEKTLCMAVYETYEDQNCVSFYRSHDAIHWEFCSRNMDLYECPDLIQLTADDGSKHWVLYSASGRYFVGKFDDFAFHAGKGEGWLDYGNACYAGQSFNNYPDDSKRLHIAWLGDGMLWAGDKAYGLMKDVGFNQSMSLICELSLHKTNDGYRVFRKPIDALLDLRQDKHTISLQGNLPLSFPCEIVFPLEKSMSVLIDGTGFSYDADTRTISSTSGKQYILHQEGVPEARLFADRRSMECFVGEEISLSYTNDMPARGITVTCNEPPTAEMWTLRSIWE